MGSVGSDLKAAREQRNISLTQIAADTHISAHYLECLEEGRYNQLPGGIYNRAFLKAYCEVLELDPEEMIKRYEAEITPPSEKPAKAKSQISPHPSSFKISPILTWSLMLAISAAGLFFSRTWIKAVFSPYFSHTPAAVVRYEPKPASVTPSPQVEPSLASSPAQTGAMEPVPPANALQPADHPADGEMTAPPNAALRIEFEVTEKCWVSIDSDGGPVVRKLLEPGQAQSFNASERFYIIVGNAGGVHLKINGKPAKPLGKPGEVVKMLIDEKNIPELIDNNAG
jgi:cytoskeleton protein RodZ